MGVKQHMSEIDLVIGFVIGLVVGAYGCWLGRDIIATGVALMKIQKEENKRCDAEETAAKEAKANSGSTTDANPLDEANTTLHQTPTENHQEAS